MAVITMAPHFQLIMVAAVVVVPVVLAVMHQGKLVVMEDLDMHLI
jgi:hypothetical protein